MFAQMDAMMNSLIVEFLADKEAVRLDVQSGATIGEAFPILFNRDPGESFGIVQADQISCQCLSTEAVAQGDRLQIDAVAYTADKVFDDGHRLTINLGRVLS